MKIVWTPDLFTFPEGEGAIDLTGRARIVVHGPYRVLEPGFWRIRVKVGVETEGFSVPLRFEWGGADDVTGETVHIKTPGLYEMSLDYDWPNGGHAALRLWVAQPVFAGRLRFLGAEVERLQDQSPPNQSSQSS